MHQIRLMIQNAKLLQQFAKEMKGDSTFEKLKTEPISVKINRIKDDKTDNICSNAVEAEAVIKIFLNGTHDATDKFVSVCISVVDKSNQSEEEFDEVSRQNVLEQINERLVVSVFLKNPEIGQESYRRDFKMEFCSDLEKNEKGLKKFIPVEQFQSYLGDGSATFGFSFALEPKVDLFREPDLSC